MRREPTGDATPTGAEALQGPEPDQLAHRLRHSGQRRSDQEDDDRGQEDVLPPVQIADLPPQWRGDRRAQHVGRDDPRDLVEPAELANDLGKGGTDNHVVEHRQEHREKQAR